MADYVPSSLHPLARLRAKTDRDLLILLNHAIEHCFELIELSAFAEAEALYHQTAALLPLVRTLPPDQFQSLCTRASELAAALDGNRVISCGA